MILVYALHAAFAPPGERPTGFIQHDQAYYLANAREMFDSRAFPFYSLPFSDDYASPAVYFQPLVAVLGAIVHLTGVDPGLLYAAFGVIAGVVAFYAALVLFDLYAGGRRDGAAAIARTVFLWGGGVLVAAALVAEQFAPSGLPRGEAMLRFDPFQGYWFLNLGRNMIYPTEAFYHALFFAAIAGVLARRYALAVVLLVVSSASHPFTGIQLIAIVTTFAIGEMLLGRPERPPRWFAAACVVALGAHVAYYLLFLPRASPEHRVLEQQWRLAWTLPLLSMLFAYGPAAAIALQRFRRASVPATLLADPKVRLALIWCAVSILLAKHELFVSPRQPLHFTRGYIWTPIALLAAPVFEGWLRRTIARGRVGIVLAAAVCLVAVADNAAWFARQSRQMVQHRSLALYMPSEAPQLFERLSAPDMNRRLLISDDASIAYLALVYTPLRAWYSHPFNTPHAAERWAQSLAFFAGAPEPAEWQGRSLVIVVNTQTANADVPERLAARGYAAAGRLGRFLIFQRGGPAGRS